MGINYFDRDDRDAKFLLFEHLEVDKLLKYDAYKDFTTDDFSMIVDEAIKVCKEVLGPTLQDGDQMDVELKDGEVTLPESFHECWKVMAENGWIAPGNSPEFGGQGLPQVVNGLVMELFTGANMAMSTYPGLAIGAGRLIENFGTEEDKALFVEKMYTGVWAGTMCLTEPDAGSDNGYLLTKAIPDPDDPSIYKIQGNKCFITDGQHDLTENIIHLTIARIEGAPAGTRGVSLFIVPKIWVNPDGSLGEPNDVICSNIEHKMGIKGSITAVLNLGENGNCRGILLGEPNTGMRKMFQMMNEARIGTGIQALGIAASAYDVARKYAKERIQGPPFTDRRAPRVPIIQHEDVRRMLMNLKAGTEAMRAFAGKLFYLLDIAENDPDEAIRQGAERQVDLVTPLIKSYCSDFGYNLCRDAMQVMGGVGYCSEFPVEQYARDCKILSIWEGVNFIQSLDLVGRKLMMENGQVFQDWLKQALAFAKEHQENPDFGIDFELYQRAAQIVGDFVQTYMQQFGEDGNMRLIPLTSTRFLDCFAEVYMGQLMLEQGLVAREKLKEVDPGSSDGVFYRGKIETARFYCRNIMTNVFSRYEPLKVKDTSAIDIPEEAF
ncbi:MAG: acyl-CoA dehydrogenase [Deltaproteobacteria bacterium]|nr:acyl-CoA dehydrogenase [Deltaproteobacteria bacterium]